MKYVTMLTARSYPAFIFSQWFQHLMSRHLMQSSIRNIIVLMTVWHLKSPHNQFMGKFRKMSKKIFWTPNFGSIFDFVPGRSGIFDFIFLILYIKKYGTNKFKISTYTWCYRVQNTKKLKKSRFFAINPRLRKITWLFWIFENYRHTQNSILHLLSPKLKGSIYPDECCRVKNFKTISKKFYTIPYFSGNLFLSEIWWKSEEPSR